MPRNPTVLIASCAAVVITALAACTGATSTHGSSAAAGPTSSGAGSNPAREPAGCRPASQIAETRMGLEVRGTGRGASLFGLLMPAKPLPITTSESVKIVWRMTGSGPLHLSATDSQGRTGLQWGPELHGSSNYDRPGREWGAGYRFGTAGCWHLQARRANASADVWLEVERA